MTSDTELYCVIIYSDLSVDTLKLGSQRGNELNGPPSSPVINLVGKIEGSFPNLHHRR